MNTTNATKKITFAMLCAPVLAALAIGLAETAAATPAGPQPSDPGTTATTDATIHGGAGPHAGTYPALQMPVSRSGPRLGGRERQSHDGAAVPADEAGTTGAAAEPVTTALQPLRPAAAAAADCYNCGPGTYEEGTTGTPPPGSSPKPGANYIWIYTDKDGNGYWDVYGGAPHCIDLGGTGACGH